MIGKKIIYGCESRGDADSAYMTRYTLIELLGYQLCLHVFHRSDADEMHNHPWPFVSFILWRGYIEESAYRHAAALDSMGTMRGLVSRMKWTGNIIRKRVYPGMVLYRKAEHAHRVQLLDGKPAMTLVFMGRKQREWGFFTKKGWQYFKAYFEEREC